MIHHLAAIGTMYTLVETYYSASVMQYMKMTKNGVVPQSLDMSLYFVAFKTGV